MKKILGVLVAIVMGLGLIPINVLATSEMTVMAAENDAVILKGCAGDAEDSGGKGIMCILGVVVDALTVGVGILGILGIVMVGIQYLTAGGNEAQTTKAKRRMLEIVIGLIAYVLAYALLKWLLPGFDPADVNLAYIGI